ncbi:hypothetical protein HY091_03120 [Candidatus Kaiserbacteria bacterium]|nr:hypothetical protein [Candidatus Kaiserbacteria bacterium]
MDIAFDKGQGEGTKLANIRPKTTSVEEFVLEKSIFSNIFEKDIQRVFLYKKTERLAKAIHLISPAFAESMSLKNRIDAIAVGLIDAAVLSSAGARTALARELLALSSVLAIARAGGFLSTMNVELISREAQLLLQEVAAYEEPRLFLEDAPTLAQMMRHASKRAKTPVPSIKAPSYTPQIAPKGHLKDIGQSNRQESVLSVIKDKGHATIKDISTIMPSLSEKTIQRELQILVASGVVLKKGERRWSTYSLAEPII